MSKPRESLAVVGLCLVLSACGGNSGDGSNAGSGGGGSGTPPSSNTLAEGAWSGTTSTRNSFDMLVLENGDLYSLYGSNTVAGFQALGFIQGASSVSGKTLTAPLVTNFNYNNTLVVRSTGALTATVDPNTSLNGTSSGSGTSSATSNFTSAPTSATYAGYSYSTPAALASVSGAWLGYLLDQSGAAVSIDATGGLSGTNLGCRFTGTVAPRASGKNVFDVNLTFGTSPCTAPGVTTRGVAISYVVPGGKRRFIAATQDSGKALGYLFYAER